MPLVPFYFKTVHAVFPDALLNCVIFLFSWQNGSEGDEAMQEVVPLRLFLKKRLWWGPNANCGSAKTTSLLQVLNALRLQLLSFIQAWPSGSGCARSWGPCSPACSPRSSTPSLTGWSRYLVQSRFHSKNHLRIEKS
jgi:hypothetical protein